MANPDNSQVQTLLQLLLKSVVVHRST
jgi:hypothetical protein